MTDNDLSKQDLFILMESYKNNIQLNTTLLEQQKQMIVVNTKFLEKQEELCKSVNEIVEKLANCSKMTSENYLTLSNNVNIMSSNIKSFKDDITNEIKNEVNTNCLKSSNEHSNLSTKIYVCMGGMITIVIAIIGLAVTYAEKFHNLKEVVKPLLK